MRVKPSRSAAPGRLRDRPRSASSGCARRGSRRKLGQLLRRAVIARKQDDAAGQRVREQLALVGRSSSRRCRASPGRAVAHRVIALALQHHECASHLDLVGQAEVGAADAAAARAAPRAVAKTSDTACPSVVGDADVVPVDREVDARAHGFGEGFLGRKALGEVSAGFPCAQSARSPRGPGRAREAVAVARQRPLDAAMSTRSVPMPRITRARRRFHSRFISRTASPSRRRPRGRRWRGRC